MHENYKHNMRISMCVCDLTHMFKILFLHTARQNPTKRNGKPQNFIFSSNYTKKINLQIKFHTELKKEK